MVKIIIGFVILAVAALFVLKNASHVDLGGEHSAQEKRCKRRKMRPQTQIRLTRQKAKMRQRQINKAKMQSPLSRLNSS